MISISDYHSNSKPLFKTLVIDFFLKQGTATIPETTLRSQVRNQHFSRGILAGLQGCTTYLDNIIMTGTALEDHNRNVHALFKSFAECGFCIGMEKCLFAKIKFLGNLISKDGH